MVDYALPVDQPPDGFDPADVIPPPLPDRQLVVNALALDLSGTCNLACRYCAEAATQPTRRPMRAETLEAAWGFLCGNGTPPRGASLRLGSGEPLLALDSLRRIAELAGAARTTTGEKVHVFLTTNGTRVDEQVGAWLIASGWHVTISLDGSRAVHDAWRVHRQGRGTFDQVARATARLAGSMADRLKVTAVLCRGANPAEVFDAIAALGVQRIELVPVAHASAEVLPDESDIARYEEFVQDHACGYLRAQRGGPELVRFADRVARAMGYDTRRVLCGAGRTFFGVGPEGDLYPCFRFIGLDSYRLGSLAKGLDQAAAAAFRSGAGRPNDQRVHCQRCWAAPLCGGPCFACAEMFGPGDGEPIGLHCRYVLADARAAVWLVGQLRRSHPEALLSFIPYTLRL
jgi:uncharacterized protein